MNLGEVYEDIAVRFLRDNGFSILARNYRKPFGEVDIVARKGKEVFFVEVRHRGDTSLVSALESVDVRKMRRIAKTAVSFIQERLPQQDLNYHFTVMDVDWDGVKDVIWSAFTLEDAGLYYWA